MYANRIMSVLAPLHLADYLPVRGLHPHINDRPQCFCGGSHGSVGFTMRDVWTDSGVL